MGDELQIKLQEHSQQLHVTSIICSHMWTNTIYVTKWYGSHFWNVSSSRVYLHIYGATKAPHKLPQYVSNKHVFLKMAYQTYVGGFGVAMTTKRKMTWPKLLLQVRPCKIENFKQAVTNTKIFEVYHLGDLPFYRHDPKGIFKKFCKKHGITWQYTHETCL